MMCTVLFCDVVPGKYPVPCNKILNSPPPKILQGWIMKRTSRMRKLQMYSGGFFREDESSRWIGFRKVYGLENESLQTVPS